MLMENKHGVSGVRKDGRDVIKYSFNGEGKLGKGRLALKIVQNASIQYNTYDGFKELFKDVFDCFSYGRMLINDYELEEVNSRRFFTNDDDQLILDGKAYYFSTQWGKNEAFDKLLRIAREELGYEIGEIVMV